MHTCAARWSVWQGLQVSVRIAVCCVAADSEVQGKHHQCKATCGLTAHSSISDFLIVLAGTQQCWRELTFFSCLPPGGAQAEDSQRPPMDGARGSHDRQGQLSANTCARAYLPTERWAETGSLFQGSTRNSIRCGLLCICRRRCRQLVALRVRTGGLCCAWWRRFCAWTKTQVVRGSRHACARGFGALYFKRPPEQWSRAWRVRVDDVACTGCGFKGVYCL